MYYNKSIKFTEKFAQKEVNIKAIEQPNKVIVDYMLDYMYLNNVKGLDPYKELLKTLPGKRFIIDCGKNINILRESYGKGLVNLKDVEYIINLLEKVQLSSIYSAIFSLKKLVNKDKINVSKEIINVVDNIVENSKLYDINSIKPIKLDRTESKYIDNLMLEHTKLMMELTGSNGQDTQPSSPRSMEYRLVVSIGSINVMAYQAYLNRYLTFKETHSIIQKTLKKLKEVGEKIK